MILAIVINYLPIVTNVYYTVLYGDFFAEIVQGVSKLSKSCVIRLTATKIYFILTENQLHGGTNLWCELPQVKQFTVHY